MTNRYDMEHNEIASRVSLVKSAAGSIEWEGPKLCSHSSPDKCGRLR